MAEQLPPTPVIDWPAFGRARTSLGANFARILGYFREDGTKAVLVMEDAVRAGNAVAVVSPAAKLKEGAFELGAHTLGVLAEEIEFTARDCLEAGMSLTPLVEKVVLLRPLFEKTLEQLDRESNPLMDRRTTPRFPNINSYASRRAS